MPVSLIFIWLNSPELGIDRVKQWVAEGGHHIPEDVIRRRYAKGIENLNERYMEMVDYWMIYDNSESSVTIIAEGSNSSEGTIFDEVKYKLIKSY
jgi:predicted ABC-type ATPase